MSRYVLAFEDQRGGGDFAYNDVIFEVSSIPLHAPEPSSLVIGGVSVLGLVGYQFSRRVTGRRRIP